MFALTTKHPSHAIRLFALALSLMLAASADRAAAQDKVLRIGTEGTFAPYNFMDAQKQLQGFDIDVANEVCKRLTMKCEFVLQDFPGMIPALTVGKFDIIGGMVITERRRETIDFSRPHGAPPTGFAAPKDSKFTKLPASGQTLDLDVQSAASEKAIAEMRTLLKGATMGAQSGSISAIFAKKYFGDIATITEYKNTQEQDIDLSNGRLDIVMNNKVVLAKSLATPMLSKFTSVGPGFTGGVLGEGYAYGLRKGDTELKEKLTRVVAELVSDGTIKRVSEKWLGFDITPAAKK